MKVEHSKAGKMMGEHGEEPMMSRQQKRRKQREAQKKEQEKKKLAENFAKASVAMRTNVAYLDKKMGVSSFTLIGGEIDGKLEYSGGMLGDGQTIGQGLCDMALQRKDVREMFQAVVDTLREHDKRKVTSVEEIAKAGDLGRMAANSLISLNIQDLKELTNYTKGEVAKFKSIGKKAIEQIESLLSERGWSFAKEESTDC